MSGIIKKIAIICFLCFFSINVFARSQNPSSGLGRLDKGISHNINSREPATPSTTSQRKSSRSKKYNGDIQFSIGYMGTKATGEGEVYNYDSSYYYPSIEKKSFTKNLDDFSIGVAHHSMFKVFSLSNLFFSVGFMEDLSFGFGKDFVMKSMLAPSLGVQIGNLVTITTGIGFDLGLVIASYSDDDFIKDPSINKYATGFAFDLQGKFFPKSRFSPAIGLQYGGIGGANDIEKADTFRLYLAAGLNF